MFNLNPSPIRLMLANGFIDVLLKSLPWCSVTCSFVRLCIMESYSDWWYIWGRSNYKFFILVRIHGPAQLLYFP